MSLPVIFRPIGQLEMDEAMEWYRGKKRGLEMEFKQAVDQILIRIASTPLPGSR